ncbi:hypothetical protein [Stutzerimonas nitrititolerans]|uniref:hypothetical protein n=1 Tax=Stutzerimonas nitrititolerans TaxID=2482751 RepID=UPI001314514B|nr:hypothetical protein [Stutzerimonas nitrititolerans]
MKTFDLHSQKFEPAWRQGWNAPADAVCPYGISRIGHRCAWLAAHRDRYGRAAA